MLRPAGSAAPTAPGSAPLRRLQWIVVGACVGALAGAALGIGGSMLVYPTSNIAPAYGILLIGPIGLLGGLVFGALRGR